jgi:uncharacterized protein (DUF885 family)
MQKFLILMVACALLAGCGEQDAAKEDAATQAPAPAVAASGPTADEIAAETARINAWFDRKFQEELDFSPIWRSYMGDRKDYDQVDDLSEEAQDQQTEWRRNSIAELQAEFDREALSPAAQLSYDLWIDKNQRAIEADQFRRNAYVINNFYSPHTTYPQFLASIHRVDEPSDMDAYIARIGGLSHALLQVLETAKLNAAAGSRQPRYSYDSVIEQSRALITGAPFTDQGSSTVWTDAQAKIDGLLAAGKIDQAQADAYREAAEKALLEHWQPAYEQLITWLEVDRVNADEIATGVGRNPNGQAYYQERLRDATTTNLTADEIHQIGLDGVASVHAEMEALKEQVGFEGTLQEFFTFVREDDQFYFPNTDEGRQAYIDTATAHIKFIQARLPEYFGVLPKADVIVKRVEPFRERDGAPQHYLLAAPDGSRPGVFYAHLSDMRAMPIPQLEVIAHHEASLGHHLQFSIAQELTDVPKFRTQLFYNAFQEGWGLYTEQLAKEMGAYQDPYSDFGRLTTKLWRYIRLVLDTGLHAKGWTEEQAVEYFKANSPAADGQIRAEVQRYILLPGQATGYMIGMLKIQELRSKAEAELGDRFDIRGFHDTLLASGQMTLPLAEQQVDKWIASQQEKTL